MVTEVQYFDISTIFTSTTDFSYYIFYCILNSVFRLLFEQQFTSRLLITGCDSPGEFGGVRSSRQMCEYSRFARDLVLILWFGGYFSEQPQENPSRYYIMSLRFVNSQNIAYNEADFGFGGFRHQPAKVRLCIMAFP